MNDIIIHAENLSKRYRIATREGGENTLIEAAVKLLVKPIENFKRIRNLTNYSLDRALSGDIMWAVNGVSFDIYRGQVVGIIGHNGAGKTTLLKILSRITPPTKGRVEIRGRLSSLLEVGTGFHPELTGRENVYLNGAILGMTKKETDAKFDAIVDFSGVGRFIDTPVKRYSSGMRVRLAFSVSAFLEPDILLVDEVLSVGDAEFQNRCLGKMEKASHVGRTVIVVSHHMATINALCDRVILLERGRIVLDGSPQDVIPDYLDGHAGSSCLGYTNISLHMHRSGMADKIRFTRWTIFEVERKQPMQINSCEPCEFRVDYISIEPGKLSRISLALTLKDSLGTALTTASTDFLNADFESIPTEGTFVLRIQSVPLAPGMYRVHLWCSANGLPMAIVANAGTFEVLPGNPYGTGRVPRKSAHGFYILQDFSWSVVEHDDGNAVEITGNNFRDG